MNSHLGAAADEHCGPRKKVTWWPLLMGKRHEPPPPAPSFLSCSPHFNWREVRVISFSPGGPPQAALICLMAFDYRVNLLTLLFNFYLNPQPPQVEGVLPTFTRSLSVTIHSARY